MLKNLGTKLDEFELCMNEFFGVSPLTRCINAGDFLEVFVQFWPSLMGTHEGEFIATYNNNNECMYCKLIGVGINIGISCPFQINYLSDLYLEMEYIFRISVWCIVAWFYFIFAYFELLFSKPWCEGLFWK